MKKFFQVYYYEYKPLILCLFALYTVTLFTLCRKHELWKRQGMFLLHVKNSTLKFNLSEVFFMIFVYFYSLLRAVISKFPDIFAYDNYRIR